MRWFLFTLTALTLSSVSPRYGFADDAPSAEPTQRQQPIILRPAAGADAPTVRITPEGDASLDPTEIGDFTLVDQNGDTVTKEDLLGTPWVASFIFTRCQSFCPNLVKSVYDLRKGVKDVDVRFVTITVDPEYDTVAQMRRYADIYEAEPPGWRFLTGDADEIYRLALSGFKVPASGNIGTELSPDFAHTLKLIHVDADGHIVGMYNSRDAQEMLILEQVLRGRRETPPENRPVPPIPTAPPAVEAGSTEAAAATEPPPVRMGDLDLLPEWAQRLPTTNAMLNGLATLLLLVGLTAIKAGQVTLHRRTMLFAFGVSIAFLGCYLAYHFALHHYTGSHGKKFEGGGSMATIYYGILISHVFLAATVPVLAIITIYRGLSAQWEKHRRIARITFPIWLYVSVTGVIIYWMLYHWQGM